MIVAAGLSPAWQQVFVLDALRPGEVNRARQVHWCASGKVINVGVALRHLSGARPGESLTLSTLGGAPFEPIDRELRALGVPARWVRTAAPTRVCTTIVDLAAQTATELVENAGEVAPHELAQFEHGFAEAAAAARAVVLTGSLPQGAPPDFYRRLLGRIECPAVLDFQGESLLLALEARPAVVKPNRQELARTLNVAVASDEDLRSAMAELLRRGAQAAVVTAGSGDVWLATPRGHHRYQPPPVDRIVNPIGCGDCLAAGLAWALGQGGSLDDAVAQGLRLAALNLQTLLPSDFDGRRETLQFR